MGVKVGIGGANGLKFFVIVAVVGSIVYLFLLEATGYTTPVHDYYQMIFER